MTKQEEPNFLSKSWMWFFQVMWLSYCRPKNLTFPLPVDDDQYRLDLKTLGSLAQVIFKTFVLVGSNVSQFAWNYLDIWVKTWLNLWRSLSWELAAISMLVSSTNITTSEILFINIGKSLIYRSKSRGPKRIPGEHQALHYTNLRFY
jgi:hypothetical protein